MEIIFSKHAKDQMIERNISKEEVLSALLNPDKIFKRSGVKSQAVKSIRKNNKTYLLVAIFRQITPRRVKIITTFLTSKINKYLK